MNATSSSDRKNATASVEEINSAIDRLTAEPQPLSKESSNMSLSPDHAALLKALKASVKPSGGPSNGGLDNHMWAAMVDRLGVVRAVCYSGTELGDQWPGSRAIAIEKANTANALSLPAFAFSTANLYTGSQPGGFLYGLLQTNPVDTATMYGGDSNSYGMANDPMVGKKASGVVVFGGGLALYDGSTIVGALGVSGDTSPGDHNVAWRVRKALGLDKVPAGITADNNDAIIYDIGLTGSSSGYGHPVSGLKEDKVAKEIGASADGK
ncbi:MAG TPA: heme-binding protein [Rhizomicrobium sp.]